MTKEIEKIDECLGEILGGPGGVDGICERIKILNEMRLDNFNKMLQQRKASLLEVKELKAKNALLVAELEQSRANCNHLQQDWEKYHDNH